jgi:hypothetical protein
MQPEVDFTLTDEEFNSYEKLLAERGIRVRAMSRETVEDLEKGGISHVCISGILVFEGAEFIYHISKFPKNCCLTVEAFAHSRSAGKALVAAIESAFPQDEHDVLSQHVPHRNRDKNDNIQTIGCFAFLVFIGAIVFFVIAGIRSVFWK